MRPTARADAPVRFFRPLAGLAVLAALAGPPAQAEPAPLWEAGAGFTALGLPDYRGSEESRGYLFPIPYFIYRGERLRVDRLGVRGLLLRVANVSVDLSAGASVPVNSSRNRARAGMPDLDAVIEAGPVAKADLWESPSSDTRLQLRLPARMAFSVSGDGVRHVGVLLNPNLALDTGFSVAGQRWNLGLVAGAQFGDRRYHGYFYDVAPGLANAARPAFEARGGYGGPQLLVSVSRRFAGAWAGAFLRYDSVRGAVFEGSPLVTARGNLFGGVALAWVFATSSRLVDRDD